MSVSSPNLLHAASYAIAKAQTVAERHNAIFIARKKGIVVSELHRSEEPAYSAFMVHTLTILPTDDDPCTYEQDAVVKPSSIADDYTAIVDGKLVLL